MRSAEGVAVSPAPPMMAHRPPSSILRETAHRPWPLPSGPWRMFMRWADLAFLHWRVPVEAIRPLVPAALAIDTFDGDAYLGVVPFRMENTRWRWAPSVPTATDFPETNVRTYVRLGDRAGVWFMSLDAASRLAVWGARVMLNLPYFHARMSLSSDGPSTVATSERIGRWRRDGSGAFDAIYRPTGEEFTAEPGTLDHWLTERYCLFGQTRRGRVHWMDVHHVPWPLRRGEVEIRRNLLAEASGIALPDAAPIVLTAKAVDVVAWMPQSDA